MADTDKAVIAAFRAASDGLQDAISGGQNADGQEVDARIAAAYEALNEATDRLETMLNHWNNEMAEYR